MSNELILLIPKIKMGGIERNFIWLQNKLINNKSKFSVIFFSENDKESLNSLKNFSYNVLFKNKLYYENSFFDNIFITILLFFFLKKKKKTNPKIKILSYKSHLIPIVVCKLLNINLTIRLSNNFNYLYLEKKFFKFFLVFLKYKYFYKLVDCIISPSKELKFLICKKFNLNSIYIPNPINKELINSHIQSKNFLNKFSDDKFLNIISVGRLSKQKNHIELLKSLKSLKEKSSQLFHCKIIGNGELKNELFKYTIDNNLIDNVEFIYDCNYPYQHIVNSNLIVLNSLYEGLPNILLEAIYLKIPIISSNCATGIHEILDNGKYGTIYNLGDYNSLTDIFANYKKNKFDLKKKSDLAFLSIDRYDENIILKKYMNLFF